jgi:hypothetical protein
LSGYSRNASTLYRAVALSVILLSIASCSGRSNIFTESRDERLRRLDQERARLARASGPVDRTRAQIRISDLLVSLMGDAVGDGDLELVEQRISEYREAVTDARDAMMNSGRNAENDAGGFRDLEIALRQHVRQLADIGSQLTFQYREPITILIDDVAEIRAELLEALFPLREPA